MRFYSVSLDVTNSMRMSVSAPSNEIGDAAGALTTRYVSADNENAAGAKATHLALADLAAQGLPQFDVTEVVSIAPCGFLTFLLRRPGKGFTFYMER